MANFKIGDKVKIRTWESMAKEFGTDRDGDISCKCWFVTDMKKYCGKVFTIKEVLCDGNYYLSSDDNVSEWKFSEDMLEDNVVKFKVGDKVIAKRDSPYYLATDGWKGVVTIVHDNGNIRVRGDYKGLMDDYFEGDVEPKYFDLDTSYNQKVVITSDGKTTTARLFDGKDVVKTAEAKCSPDDEFDFNTGASIAFSRLNANEEGHEFTKADLETGMFVHNNRHGWGAVVNDKIIYEEEGFDKVADLSDDLRYLYSHIDTVVNACSFSDAKHIANTNIKKFVLYRRSDI